MSDETVYEHVPEDGEIFIVTASERWSVGMIKRLKKSRPDEVKITAVNKDGSLVAELPLVDEDTTDQKGF